MYDVIGDADTFSLVSGVYENDTADIGEIDDERYANSTGRFKTFDTKTRRENRVVQI